MKNSKTESSLRPLTKKEKKVLEFIESYMQSQQVAPSYQEIQDHFGFKSINSVQSYLRQLQAKGYIHNPGGNQKRAISLLQSAQTVSSSLGLSTRRSTSQERHPSNSFYPSKEETPALVARPQPESLSLPLLGRVAAGAPIEAFDHDEFVEVPASMVRNPGKTFALRVEGQSMIEDGILDGDLIFVQQQSYANNGEIVVAIVDNEATVKHFYLHRGDNLKVIPKHPQSSSHRGSASRQQVELRPANATMESMWFQPEQVEIRGVVVGLLRHY
ncbi:MAG: transcriptional repressor LexA [Bdellovibrionales bacterium]|nr:transcriptional repressor LexA [Bdellovibrionales bacterium]